ncbi:26S proteasome regulatory complex, subunit PSMD10 [Handroanthus impetiginosus]|uniref:26S proteasome regulatory complex, subunit PSMD10 n=1 Tax=Handroanthus impetiginosus TaxID=429701 RepID=A0A2G9GLT1_9LAMI|nr:26S proteasome regulatory complex, subunit PSMD10 [Handroanthus impetiginosus]
MSRPKYPGLLEEEEENYETVDTMDPKLYRATTEGDILEFIRAIEQGTIDQHHSPPASCVQLGPQKTTVLHIATSFALYEIVKLICQDLPFFVAEKNAKGDTPLHIAARAGDSLLVTLLVHSDCREGSLGEKNEEGNTALHEALKCGHEEVARILINKNPEMPYSLNKEGKSLLYLAAEAGFVTIVRLLMDNPVGNYTAAGKHKSKSPVFAAIRRRNIDVVRLLWEKDPSLFQLRNRRGENPLHAAVHMEYTEGVKFLLDKHYEFAYQKEEQGFYPIHSASNKDLVDIIKLMLHSRPDIRELLTPHGQNMLHAAARSGKYKAVEYMLKMPELEKLINEKDKGGNTPLHLATICGHTKVVGILVRDRRVNLKLVNNNYQTALDIAEEQMEMGLTSFQKMQRLTCMALRVGGAPRAHQPETLRRLSIRLADQQEAESWRDKINVILLVATVIATVTFTAGFAIPGGYNNTNPNPGIATMLEKMKFQEFVICDTIAMYSSVIVVVTLIWAQLGDPSYTRVALKWALPLLGLALTMMSIAFLAGVYLVVSKLNWLANFVLLIGSSFITVIALIFIPLHFLGSSNYHVFRHLSYYPFCLVLYTLGA